MTNAATIPMQKAPHGSIWSQPAVIATRPAKGAFNIMETLGFLYLIQVINRTVIVEAAAAILEDRNTLDAVTIVSESATMVEQALNANQPNHRTNVPIPANVRECAGISLDFLFLSYLPIRGPRIAAPTRAMIPPRP